MELFKSWDELKSVLILESETKGLGNIVYFVNNKVRKQSLLGVDQGNIKLRNSKCRMMYVDFGGGIWQATIMG